MRTWKSLLAAVVVAHLLSAPATADLFVSSSGSNQVDRYSNSGVFQSSFVSGITSPQGIAFDSSGNFFVATGGSIQKYTVSGTTATLVSTWTVSFTTSNPQVHDLVFDSVHNVLYASVTRSNGNDVIATVSGLGGPTGSAATLTTAVNAPEGLAVNAAGTTLYVANTGTSMILQVDTASGATSTFVANTGGTVFDITFGPSDNAGGTPDLYGTIMAGARSNTVVAWEGTTGALIDTFAGGLNNPAGLAFRPSDNILAISNRGTNTIVRSAGSPPGPAGGYTTSTLTSGTQPTTPTYLQFHTAAVPEPGLLALFGMAGVVMGGYAWRCRKAKAKSA
jgi:sugar lactone lactonase YvrE